MRLLFSILAAMSLLMVSLSSFAINTQGMKVTIHNKSKKHVVVKNGQGVVIKRIRPESYAHITQECKVPFAKSTDCQYEYGIYTRNQQTVACVFQVSFTAETFAGATDASGKIIENGTNNNCSVSVESKTAGPGKKVEVKTTF